jgi:hypothetical protein
MRARYIAEAGMATYLDTYWISGNPGDAPSPFSDTLANGNYVVTLVSSSGNQYTLQAVGNYRNAKVQIDFVVTYKNNWNYVIYSDDEIEFEHGSGTITGNVHANDKVEIDDDYTVSGTITQAPPEVSAPTIDWDFFRNQAIAAGQYVHGHKTFDAAGSPYTGVWYVTMMAKIKSNAVINGTIVTEKDCKFDGDNATVTATPTTYPAIVTAKSVKGHKDNIQINGFVYCSKEWELEGDSLRLTGALVALEEVEGEGNDAIFTYDSQYISNLTGVSFGSTSSPSLQILNWTEN